MTHRPHPPAVTLVIWPPRPSPSAVVLREPVRAWAAAPSYACQAPEGVACHSVSGTYANAIRNNLPSQRRQAQQQPDRIDSLAATRQRAACRCAHPHRSTSPFQPAALQGLATPLPLRSQASRVLRLWTKPWEDA
jgi:conjugal transfer pilus assembly protein TraV